MDAAETLFRRARRVLPGGVSSPVRAVKPYPRAIARGRGPRVEDVDGRSYVDLCLAFGPLIVGHAHPLVVAALERQLAEGWNFGANNVPEVALGEALVDRFPAVDAVRFVNSGTEATMAAVRLARGATGRSGIAKVDGAYHGAHDAVLVRAGSGVETHGIPGTDGVPADVAALTSVVPFNDADAAARVVEDRAEDLACLLLEPVLGNVGTIPPEPGYLDALRKVTRDNDVLLVFDEVITGLRLGPGGAQERYGVAPDLTCLGKVVGGGLPVGALGGRRELMDLLSPEGPVYQAGTASGNPLTMAAGLATLEVLEARGWRGLQDRGDALRAGLQDLAADHGVPASVQGVGSMLSLFLHEGPVRDAADARSSDVATFQRFLQAMLENGVYLPPSPYETSFLSTAHGDDEVAEVLEAADGALGSALP